MAGNRSSIVVKNPTALIDVLDRAELATSESALRKAAGAGAGVFRDEIQLRAPRDTGNLADSAIVFYDKDNSVAGKLATYVVTFTKSAWYARLLEFGTSRMAAKPFIRPAFESMKDQAAQVVIEKIQEVIKNG